MADRIVRIAASLVLFFALAACGDSNAPKIEEYLKVVDAKLIKLGDDLDQGNIRNAKILREYSGLVSEQFPDYAPIAKELGKDSTRQGPLYKGLMKRFTDARDNSALFVNSDARLEELSNLNDAVDPATFNDLLSDPINVLADLSDGKLARVNSLSQEQSLLANQADDLGPGSQLIGNPSYGQWSTGSNGMSFWQWYGMYAMFDTIFGNRYGYDRRMGYGDWYRRRDYSYYNDYGRYRYSSPRQYQQSTRYEQTAKKTFANDARFNSRYGKNRSGGSKLSSGSQKAQTANNRFRSGSSFAKKSTYSKNASFRDSRTNTSRGVRRGK